MITVNRDYGALQYSSPPNNTFNITPHRQVFLATHEGENSLPFMNRSFISFSYGKKGNKRVNIEDFDLIATTVSDSLNRNGYAQFNDITSSYDNLDGQQYWNTHYTTNSMEMTLATDGMNQQKLDEFLLWFRAGEVKELILAEHPNRAILARVSDPPKLDLLPFEEKVKVTVSGYDYETSTTLYKGHITLNFIMDDPYWYAITNIIGIKDGDHYIDYWQDVNGDTVSVFASKDALKILYEDGIPLGSMIDDNMLLGNGAYANVDDNISSCVWDTTYTGTPIENTESLPGGGACVMNNNLSITTYKGIIAGAIIGDDGTGIESLSAGSNGYFFYSGTAPAPTIISFTLTPTIDSNGYINVPANSYSKHSTRIDGVTESRAYDVLTIESREKYNLYLTTPNVYTSFNAAINVINTYITNNSTKSWEDLRTAIRENVRHLRVREWAIAKINYAASSNENSMTNTDTRNGLRASMADFLKSNGSIRPASFEFNSETGAAKATFQYQVLNNSGGSTLTTVEENVGDMLRSNYLIIRERNYPTNNGKFVARTDSHPEYSHRIYHNLRVPLQNLQILYKNRYL